MKAKEMFEALGCECVENSDFYLIYIWIFKENGVQYEIEFSLEDKEVAITPTYNDEKIYFVLLEMKLLKAINQQCKELGWLDE